jgi:hypothetical protein
MTISRLSGYRRSFRRNTAGNWIYDVDYWDGTVWTLVEHGFSPFKFIAKLDSKSAIDAHVTENATKHYDYFDLEGNPVNRFHTND